MAQAFVNSGKRDDKNRTQCLGQLYCGAVATSTVPIPTCAMLPCHLEPHFFQASGAATSKAECISTKRIGLEHIDIISDWLFCFLRQLRHAEEIEIASLARRFCSKVDEAGRLPVVQHMVKTLRI